MSDELPRRRTLESLKKEAKHWLAALRDGDADAWTRFQRAIPDAPAEPGLRDVQHALAREQGLAGWNELVMRLAVAGVAARAALARYEEMAQALLDAYHAGTPEAMERHWALTWHRRAWKAMRTYVQLDLGRQVGDANLEADITLDDAQRLVAREHRFESWKDLVRTVMSAASGVGGREVLLEGYRGPVTDQMLAALPLEELTELDLSGSAVTDQGLAVLRRATQLERISLAGTRITDQGVEHLRACERLQRVDLQHTQTGDGALRSLAGRPALADLRTGERVTDAGLGLLREFPVFRSWQGGEVVMGLTSPDAGPNHLLLRGAITDRGMRTIAGLEGVFALNIDARELPITGDGVAALVALPHLGWLAVDATDATMPSIARMASLRFLSCQDTVAGDDGFVALSASPSIEGIWGRRCHNLRTRGFSALANMPSLARLSVSCLNVEDAGIALLPSFPALQELMPMDVPDAGYRHIGKCEGLESLVLMYCRATGDEATGHITSLPRLRRYFASYTRITDRTPELLATMHSLESVDLDSCAGITDRGVQALVASGVRRVTISGRVVKP